MAAIVNDLIVPILIRFVPMILATAIGLYVFKKQHLHKMRMDLFSDLMGNRHNLTGDAFTTALNRVFVVFDDDPAVIRAVREFTHVAGKQSATNKDLINIFRPICRNLKIGEAVITDGDFETAFNAKQDGQPIPVVLTFGQSEGPNPQVALFGHKPPGANPFTVTLFDAPALDQVINTLQAMRSRMSASQSHSKQTN